MIFSYLCNLIAMNSFRLKYWYIVVLLTLLASACGKNVVMEEYEIIPEPAYIVQKGRSFTLTTHTKLCFENIAQNSPTAKIIATTLRKKRIRPAFIGKPNKNCITFTLNDTINTAIGDEGYLLQVRPEGIFISANTEAGLFYGFRTFIMMLPPDIQHGSYRRVTMPECTVLDYPRFGWRGSHLDCCRHFFNVKQIKKHLDLMAAFKLNKFHWHLADDQGWRIEIDQYPQLNDIGSWHVDRCHQPWGEEEPPHPGEEPTYGGFYTKSEIAEIVKYAADRNIEVIPEIDLTSHCSPILAAYPELACNNQAYTVAIGPCWPSTAVLCAGNDQVLDFLNNVLDEVAQMFPSEFIHIGLAESDKSNWENCDKCQARMRRNGLTDENALQGWLVQEIETILSRKGKRIIGWDDLLDCHMSPDAVLIATKGDTNILRGAFRGNGVIAAPPEFCSLDYYQTDSAYHSTRAFPQLLPLYKVYQFDPMPLSLTHDVQCNLWGGEALLWTEYAVSYDQAEYMLLPRICALAECFWTPADRKDWNRFRRKVESSKLRMGAMNYNYCRGSFRPLVSTTDKGNGLLVEMSTEVANTYIYFTTDGSDPTPESTIYEAPLLLPYRTHLRAITLYNGEIQEGIHDFYL